LNQAGELLASARLNDLGDRGREPVEAVIGSPKLLLSATHQTLRATRPNAADLLQGRQACR
jgi:hypothetical protein